MVMRRGELGHREGDGEAARRGERGKNTWSTGKGEGAREGSRERAGGEGLEGRRGHGDEDDGGSDTGACGSGSGIDSGWGGIEARGGGGVGSGCGRGIGSCGGGDSSGGGGRYPSIFREQVVEREFTPFFLQMTARVCGRGGGGPFPSYTAQDRPREERAHLRPTTRTPKMIIKIIRDPQIGEMKIKEGPLNMCGPIKFKTMK